MRPATSGRIISPAATGASPLCTAPRTPTWERPWQRRWQHALAALDGGIGVRLAQAMQRPLIAHIIPWTNIAGTELATIRLAEAARAEGYDNILYVPDLPGAAALEALCHRHGLETTRYHQPVIRRSRPWPYLANTARLAADFRRRGVKLVHNGEVMGAYFTALAGASPARGW